MSVGSKIRQNDVHVKRKITRRPSPQERYSEVNSLLFWKVECFDRRDEFKLHFN